MVKLETQASFIHLSLKEIELHGPHDENYTAGEPYLIFHLRPTSQRGYDRTEISSKWNTLAEKVRERELCLKRNESTVSEIKDCLKNFTKAEKFVCRKEETSGRDIDGSNNDLATGLKNLDKDFSVVFLGTGASLPSKYRNVSCTLVNIRYTIFTVTS